MLIIISIYPPQTQMFELLFVCDWRAQNIIEGENIIEDQQINGFKTGNRIGLSITKSRLFIDCANAADEATYTCVAENPYSRISSHTKFTLAKPLIQSSALENDLSADIEDTSGFEAQSSQTTNENGIGDASLVAVPQCLTQQNSAKITSCKFRAQFWVQIIP